MDVYSETEPLLIDSQYRVRCCTVCKTIDNGPEFVTIAMKEQEHKSAFSRVRDRNHFIFPSMDHRPIYYSFFFLFFCLSFCCHDRAICMPIPPLEILVLHYYVNRINVLFYDSSNFYIPTYLVVKS